MAGLWGSFEDVKRALGIVCILLVITFFGGFIAGYMAGSSNAPRNPTKTLTADQEREWRERMDKAGQKVDEQSRNSNDAADQNKSNSKTMEKDAQKLLDDFDKANPRPSPSANPPAQ